jgi:hypothetical protein
MSNIFNVVDGDEDFLNFNYIETKEQPKSKSSKSKSSVKNFDIDFDEDIPPPRTKSKKKSHVSEFNQIHNDDKYNFYDLELDTSKKYDVNVDDNDVVETKGKKKVPLKQVQEHQLLINQINAYTTSQRFKPILDECGIKIKDLGSKSVAELKELRERIRASCANYGASGIVAAATLSFCGGVEALAPKRLINLEGYKSAIESNPEFHALAEMIEIDSGFKNSMTPMQRMIMCLGSTALQVGAQNRAKGMILNSNQSLINSLNAQRQQQMPPISQPPINMNPMNMNMNMNNPMNMNNMNNMNQMNMNQMNQMNMNNMNQLNYPNMQPNIVQSNLNTFTNNAMNMNNNNNSSNSANLLQQMKDIENKPNNPIVSPNPPKFDRDPYVWNGN